MKQASSGTAASPLSLPISVRAYAAEVDLEAIAEPASEDGASPLPKPRPPKLNEPSAWTFVFDTETTIPQANGSASASTACMRASGWMRSSCSMIPPP